MTARHNITVTKGTGLHWKYLPQAVAEAGCVLVNWPEDVPFPCDNTGSKTTLRGIAILKQPARVLLLAAFDHPTLPLGIEKRYGSGKHYHDIVTWLSYSLPVISLSRPKRPACYYRCLP